MIDPTTDTGGPNIDNAAMQRLNFEVDGKKRSISEVTDDFLREKGIL